MVWRLAALKQQVERLDIKWPMTKQIQENLMSKIKKWDATQWVYSAIYQDNIKDLWEYIAETYRETKPLMTSTAQWLKDNLEWIAEEIKMSNDPKATAWINKLEKINNVMDGMFSNNEAYSMFIPSLANVFFENWRQIIDQIQQSGWVWMDELRKIIPFLINTLERWYEQNWQKKTTRVRNNSSNSNITRTNRN